MLTITHKTASVGSRSLLAGVVVLGSDLARALIAAGAATERRVIATAKHYCGCGSATRAYGERAEIADPEDALAALAMGRARLDPPLDKDAALAGVTVSGEAPAPLAGFVPRAAVEKAGADKAPSDEDAAALDSGAERRRGPRK